MSSKSGLTLLEMLLVVTILGILSAIVYIVVLPAENVEKARTANARESLVAIGRAAQIYATENAEYPPDVVRGIPEGFIEYLVPGSWPNGPFPGSVFDWDNWTNTTCWDGTTGNVQVTLRQISGYKNKTDYTLYYVLEGVGIPHCSTSSVRGECINCLSRYP